MQEPSGRTTQIQNFLDRVLQGDMSARQELHEYTYGRFVRLTSTILRGDAVLKQELARDVWHTAWMKVEKDLDRLAEWKKGKEDPNEPYKLARHFLNRVATIIRHSVVEIARRRPRRKGKLVRTGVVPDVAYDPVDPFANEDVHEQVAFLTDQEQEIVGQHIYDGMPFVEIATLQGIPVTTVRGRWQRLIKKLRQALKDRDPGS